MMIAAMVALVVVVGVAPALAQSNDFFDRFANNDFLSNFFNRDRGIEQSVDQQSQSGDVSLGYSVTNTGDYASQCTPAIQFGNTGNFQNASSFVQFGSGFNNDRNDFGHFGNHFFNRGGIDDFEPGGIEVSFDPQQTVDCSNTIQQSSAAS